MKLVARTAAVALACAVAPAMAGGTSAAAATADPNIGAVTFATRIVLSGSPTSVSQAEALYNAAPATWPGYCTKQIAALPGASNHAVCSGSMRNIGFHVTVPFTTATAGTWSFRVGADFGHGGALLVDGQEVASHWYDIWWNNSWTNPAQSLQGSLTLGAGAHTIELYGFENCCDGGWGAQLEPPGGAWQDVDTSPPTVAVTGVTATAYEFGAVPVAGCSVSDAFDGNLSFPATLSAISGPRAAVGLGEQTASCAYTDSRHLSGADAVTYTIVDTTPPVVTLGVPSVTVEATGPYGAAVTYPPATAVDNVDGPLTPTCAPASGSIFPPGTTTVTCSATDIAGNTGTASFPVTVTYVWSGFLQPLVDGGSYHLGRTIPVKFALTGVSGGIDGVVATLDVAPAVGGNAGTWQPATSTSAATTGNLFRDAGDGRYIFELATKPLSAGTWMLRVGLADGSSHVITIALT